jgi:hypothetical protein
VTLASIQACRRAVAPFWVRTPESLALDLDWHEEPDVPFHTTTQPGPGVTLYATNRDAPIEIVFEAKARITTASGAVIERTLDVPVCVLPR